ncbi:hypothetical protein C0J52_17746 [Blattella germanica]|nr:hypothetical protein C0J52_17746 [Blattella germanica]
MTGPKMAVLGETVRLVAAGTTAVFELSALGFNRDDIDVQIISPSKRPVTARLVEEKDGEFRVEFTPTEVGSHLVEVSVAGQKLPAGPLVAKVYNSALIRVTDVGSGVVGQPCQFRVDASQAGEGQLEISINEGEVPNHVQVVGGGRCLVSFTPEQTKPHLIDIKFNGETVTGCPFVCSVSDTSRVSLTLRNLELIPVNEVARFHMGVDGSGSAELAVSVRGPTTELPVKVTGNIHSGFTAEFTPRDVGAHSITVEYNGHPVNGTPFVAKAYDAKRVFVGPLPKGSVGKTLQFMVDASQAGEGNLEITISARGHNIPTQVHPQGNARFAVSFVPIEPTDHVISINFNKESVPGSPFLARVQGDSPHQILVSGSSLSSAAVGKTSFFTVSNVAGTATYYHCYPLLRLTLTGPNGQSVPAQVKDTGSQTFQVEFSPRVAGEHRIAVAYRKVAIAGSPFSCKVYDVKAIKVKDVAKGIVAKPITFLGLEKVAVNRAAMFCVEADPSLGRPDVQVLSPTRRPLTVDVGVQAGGRYTVHFTPTDVGDHSVEVKLAGVHVEGSPFLVKAYDAAKVKVTDINSGVVGKPVYFSIFIPFFKICFIKSFSFTVNASQAGAGNLEIIVSVGGRNVPNYVQSEGNAKFRVNFKPQEAAPHSLSVRFNGEPVPGSPFLCKVLDANQVLVSGSALKMSPLGRSAVISVDPQITSGDLGTCDVTVTSPTGHIVPVRITKSDKLVKLCGCMESSLTIGINLISRHSVAVMLDGDPVKGSPYACNIYDVSKVKVTGLVPSKAKNVTIWCYLKSELICNMIGISLSFYSDQFYLQVGKPATFTVDASEAGEGTLELVVSTSKATVKAEVVACSRGLYDVTFVPHEAVRCPFEVNVKNPAVGQDVIATGLGTYKIDVTQGARAVRGSPYYCQVFDASKVRIEDVGSKSVAVNEKIAFKLNRREAGFAELDVTVTSPLGQDLPLEVKSCGNEKDCDLIEFCPSLPGSYRFKMTYGGEEIPVEDTGIAKASGDGLQSGQVGSPVSFKVLGPGLSGKPNVHVDGPDSVATSNIEREADGIYVVTYTPLEVGVYDVRVDWDGTPVPGSPFHPKIVDPRKVRVIGGWESFMDSEGQLTAECRGPSGNSVPIAVEPTSGSRVRLLLTPRTVGEHLVYLQYGGFPLPRSPILGVADGGSGASSGPVRVVLTGRGLAGAKCHEEAEFTIDGSQAGPEYSYYAILMFRQVKGCPLKVAVTAVADASRVVCSGDGLRVGTVGKEIRSFIDTRRAGPGELTAHCVGPHKVAYCELYDHGDGTFTLNVKPQEAGRHALTIKYGGDHVPGSPFSLRVAGAPDPSKVRVYGPGIEHGVLATFQSRFICDTRGAGAGQLTVRIRGPKGAFRVEMQRESQKDRTILCKFDPTEPGDYRVEVKWAGELVPGSPFIVMIFDTQEELNRFLQGSHSPGSELYGSVGYSTGYAHMNFGGTQQSWRGSQPQL